MLTQKLSTHKNPIEGTMKRILILMLLGMTLFAFAQIPAAAALGSKKQSAETPAVTQKVTPQQIQEELITYDSGQEIKAFLKGETTSQLIYTSGVIIFTFLAAGLVAYLLRRKWKRIQEKGGAAALSGRILASPVSTSVIIAGLYLSILPYLVSLPLKTFRMTERVLEAALCAMVAWLIYRFVDLLDYALEKIVDKSGNHIDVLILGIIRRIAKVTVVILSILFIGQNILNLNITTLLAGAGVVGLAVAFAAQDTIANFFGSIMLIIDKPFGVGDFIKLDTFSGTVERVGLRSTAIRTLDGNLITIPNKNAAGVPVENVSMRPNIKKILNLGLTYDTSPEKMRRAIEILHEIFDNHEGMAPELPPKINFTEFKDFSLNIQVIVWYHPNDFMKSLEWMTEKNLEILDRFNAEGLDFAFPSNTTYLAYDAKRRIGLDITAKSE